MLMKGWRNEHVIGRHIDSTAAIPHNNISWCLQNQQYCSTRKAILPNCSFIFAWMQRSVIKKTDKWFLEFPSTGAFVGSVFYVPAWDYAKKVWYVKKQVNIRWTVNKLRCGFFYRRTVKFCSFLFFDWNPVIHFLVTILVVFSWWLTVILSGFVYSFALAGSKVYSLFDFLAIFLCLSRVNSCFCFAISWLVQ